jgi:hypothetical protein
MMNNIQSIIEASICYIPSAWGGMSREALWRDIDCFCLFLGHSRSGHSLVGALLNAHPNIAISHESEALKYIYAGFSRQQVYNIIWNGSVISGEVDRDLGGYNYFVPNQWQGRIRKLKVIGDKQGEGTVLRIAASPRYIKRLNTIIDANIKFIHITRNPFDNIATISKKTPKLNYELQRSIDYYFKICRVIEDFKQSLDTDSLVEIKHEEFINSPKYNLEKLCHFLNVEPFSDYLEDCEKVVYQSPNKSRYQVAWTPELVNQVESQLSHFHSLNGYSFES